VRVFVLRLVGLLIASYAVGLLRPAVAGDSDEFRAIAPSAPSNVPDIDAVCNALAAAAQENDLPIDFFTRLIWQESRFDPTAVSRAGAQGAAQFMPDTATRRGLSDPFDPLEAILKSAKLLRDLRREFGNLGLAAAAYNAGAGRVHDWLAGRRELPGGDERLRAHRNRPIAGAMGRR
jgi:soluble lytic murein transglycosylase-like protein